MSVSVSKNAMRAMIAIVLVLLLVAIFANVQRARRSKIESSKFVPATRATPAPTSP